MKPNNEDLPTLETLLSRLDRNAMQTLVLNLLRRRPEWTAEIESEIASLASQLAQGAVLPGQDALVASPPPVPVVPATVRREVRAVLKAVARTIDDYWNDDSYAQMAELEEVIAPFVESAQALIEAGDGRGALPTLEAITEELVDGWDLVEDVVGDGSELFDDLGLVWAEAVLTAELTPQERRTWIARLEKWQAEGESYGADDGLAAAVEAIRQGWEYPPLVRVLQGEITDKGAWEGDAPDCADMLAVARLNVLERQGRLQEAAYLAESESEDDRYMALLVRLGRAEEAVEFGMNGLTTPEAALALAGTLQEHGETALAFRIAEHGLSLQGSRYSLAIWLRDAALASGDTERAIQAAKKAIEESIQINDYLYLQEFAGDRWPSLKDEILAFLRESQSYNATGKVDIFLHEGLQQDALDAVRNSWDWNLVARVVEAATTTFPQQVIPICQAQAATIMDAGKADRYHHAARWVERARDAYRAADQESEWQSYKAGLLATHHRKYKLVPMLRDI